MVMMIKNHAVQFLICVNTGQKDIFGFIAAPWNITPNVMSAIRTNNDDIYGKGMWNSCS